ncbi:MFS transporter [Herbiconiux solani]|uniref:MFS transporter n=1 Tax=Herbiconiux solani TaxID=661329 RepID=UPI0008241BAB|nr:MFS transporter [Herbiconiux solani]
MSTTTSAMTPTTPPLSPHRWAALVVLAVAQFLVVLDASIVNIALPSIGSQLGLDTAQLSGVITAYVLPFGGLLLLGGRLADRFGHRRVFLIGIAGFIAASALAGLAPNGGLLLAARALQGASAALLAPASLAIVTRLFVTPADRAKALGVWGAVAGIGSAAGVLLGGVLTAAFGWPAIFFVNVPAGLFVLLVLPRLVRRDRMNATDTENTNANANTSNSNSTNTTPAKLDLPGAATVTGGLIALVAGLSAAGQAGFGSPLVIALFAVAVALLTAFALIERRSPAPLVDLAIFRRPAVTGGNLAMLLIGAATTATFFALSVFMQDVLGFDALTSGLTQLPLAGTLVVAAATVPALMARIGARPVLVGALVVLAAGLIWLSFAPAGAGFVSDLLAPTIVIGAGLGASFVAVTDLAVSGTSGTDAGLASGLVNTSQQIGGALGLAVLSTIAAAVTSGALGSGAAPAVAATSGFSAVFVGGALAALVAATLVLAIRPARARRA